MQAQLVLLAPSAERSGSELILQMAKVGLTSPSYFPESSSVPGLRVSTEIVCVGGGVDGGCVLTQFSLAIWTFSNYRKGELQSRFAKAKPDSLLKQQMASQMVSLLQRSLCF